MPAGCIGSIASLRGISLKAQWCRTQLRWAHDDVVLEVEVHERDRSTSRTCDGAFSEGLHAADAGRVGSGRGPLQAQHRATSDGRGVYVSRMDLQVSGQAR